MKYKPHFTSSPSRKDINYFRAGRESLFETTIMDHLTLMDYVIIESCSLSQHFVVLVLVVVAVVVVDVVVVVVVLVVVS